MATIRNGKRSVFTIDCGGKALPAGEIRNFSIDQSSHVGGFVTGLPNTTFTIEGVLDAGVNTRSLYDAISTGAVGFSIGKPNSNNNTQETSGMNLYEYAVIYVPEDDDGNVIKKDARILIEPTTKLAISEDSVRKTALRQYDDTGIDEDFVRVLVTPF